jgi:tetratricopeptide (TPR) repeat protein
MDSSGAAARDAQLALARAAEERGDAGLALTHLAAACALGGVARDWLALGERLVGETASRALLEALDALGDDVADEPAEPQIALGVAERANGLGRRDIAQDALGVAMLAGPEDDLRRRFLRALRLAFAPDSGEPTESTVSKVGRNEPCPCGSGKKYKRCHAILARPSEPGRLSDDALLLRLAESYALSEDGPRALELLRRWVPRSGPVNILAGLIDASRGDRDEARRELRLAVRAATDDLELHHDLLRALGRISAIDHELALETLEHAPPRGDPVSLRLTGVVWLAVGLPKAAAELLSAAAQRQRDPAERELVMRTLAAARAERGDYAGALGAAAELADLRPEDRAAAACWAAWVGDPSLAERIAELRAADATDEASLAEGIAALVAGDNAGAIELLEESLAPGSDHWLAEAFDALGQDEEARDARRDCVTAEPLGGAELAEQVECLLALEGPASAEALANRYEFIGLQPIRAVTRIALRTGDLDAARHGVQHLLAEAEADVQTLLLAAEWQAGKGELAASLADFDAALARQPRRHRIRFARAELLRQLQRTEEAVGVLEELTREAPSNWRYRVALAEIWDEIGEVGRSREAWRAAHRLAPEAPAVARAIGRIEGEDRALVRAREEAQAAVRSALGDITDQLHVDARGALFGAEQDWRSLGPDDDHSTVVTQLAKAVEIELMRRVFGPFRAQGSRLADERADVGGFGRWCRGQIASLSLGEMAFAIGALARDDLSRLLDAFLTHLSAATDAPWDLVERLGVPLRLLAARRNAAVHKESVSRAEAEDSRRAVLGQDARRGIIAEVVARFPDSASGTADVPRAHDRPHPREGSRARR